MRRSRMKSTTPRLSLPTWPDPLTGATTPCKGFAGLKSTDRAAREEIQHRAYSIWASAGRPQHREMEHWLAAESEVLGEASGLRES